MLEKTYAALGHMLSALRAGPNHLTWNRDSVTAPETLQLKSPIMENGGKLPAAFTDDGGGRSPPISWSNAPEDAKSLILVIEDADSPTPLPIIHALAARPSAVSGVIVENGLAPGESDWVLGKNTFGKLGYLAPDPPKGHGPHRYIFQLFALSSAPHLKEGWGKNDLIGAIENTVIARGRLEATYEREE